MRNNKYRLSIERDVLRVNGEGALSKQGFPKTISSDNKFIVEQDDNYLNASLRSLQCCFLASRERKSCGFLCLPVSGSDTTA